MCVCVVSTDVLVDSGELFPSMQLLEETAVVADCTRSCLHHHHQYLYRNRRRTINSNSERFLFLLLTVVQCLPDEEENGCYAVSVKSVECCVEKCPLLVHALVPLQTVGLCCQGDEEVT